jgi:hypothetical protein
MRAFPIVAGLAVAALSGACNSDRPAPPPTVPMQAASETPPPPTAEAQPAPTPDTLSCTTDADCVAVEKNGCCRNGTKEAVAATAVDEYRASFTCPNPHPICPMIRILDTRVAECSNATHHCEMVKPDDIKCGGFIKNAHDCPPDYHCVLNRIPDMPGTCVK